MAHGERMEWNRFVRGMVCGQTCVPDDGGNSRLGHMTKAAMAHDCGSENELSFIDIFDEVGRVLIYSIEISENLIKVSIRT